jgi:hypothetical protein
MPSTYTPSGVELIDSGEQSGQWGNTTNINLQILDRMISQAGAISLSGTTHTLTLSDGALSDGQYAVLVFGGSPSGTNTVTISPNDAKRIFVLKNGSGETVTLTQGSGGNVSVADGRTAIVYCDGGGSGAAVVNVSDALVAATLSDIGALTPTDGNFVVGNGTTWVAESGNTVLTSIGVTATFGELNTLDGITATTAELNILDGVTASTAEINLLDGVTATTAELNILDGVTATTAELNYVDGVTSAIQAQLDGKQPLDADLTAIAALTPTDGNFVVGNGTTWVAESGNTVLTSIGVTATAAELNKLDGVTWTLTDYNTLTATAAELNKLDGVTWTLTDYNTLTATAAELNRLDGVTWTLTDYNTLTATAAELNILDGVTASTAEINLLDGVTATTAELNILDGVTADATEINLLDGKTLSGSDTEIITGTAGSDGDIVQWNADGDLVSYGAATQLQATWEAGTGTTESLISPAKVKAAIDARVYEDGEDATTSGATHDFTSIPAGVNEIDIFLDSVSATGTNDFLIQIGTGGTPTTTGYYSVSTDFINTATSTIGFVMRTSISTRTYTATMQLRRIPGTNKWQAQHLGTNDNVTAVSPFGYGYGALSGTLDNIRLRTSGADTFDAGGWSIRCRK